MDYTPDKAVIARRIARLFRSGDVVNLGIGLPTLVAEHLPAGVTIVLQSENGLMGLGPAPAPGQEDRNLVNAGGAPISVLPGGCFFDSAASFGIIRGGHVDYTVLGVLEVDQEGNLANYKVPGKLVPGMGGAMDLVAGARTVVAATLHFEPSGASRLRRRCALPLTAAREVDLVVTDLGLFEVREGRFLLRECLGPHPPEWILARTDADIEVAEGAWKP
ncbi:3-oxoacid CoA-transferase subunit B [Mesoterricola sediminis]|uniref:Succinyl-CoA--3-ketoacid-CoA transferase n=1 Tax=Mesoterricola sediminis TaxID=2927980 RepID=A0AA48H9U2_9BACT|nr:3-oxoacid CoA-transferase subunit B [Mesoterricola sediminis]BDU78553.1 succinyl-CoA--3-ketoacid-CoA transferase [Mesoterricola sediminis]